MEYGILRTFSGQLLKFTWFNDLDTIYTAAARRLKNDPIMGNLSPSEYLEKNNIKSLQPINEWWYNRIVEEIDNKTGGKNENRENCMGR